MKPARAKGVISLIPKEKILKELDFEAKAKAKASESTTWTPQSKRTGLLGQKVGMSSDWDNNGYLHSMTAIWVFIPDIDTNTYSRRFQIVK